jgi:hypothetical protein
MNQLKKKKARRFDTHKCCQCNIDLKEFIDSVFGYLAPNIPQKSVRDHNLVSNPSRDERHHHSNQQASYQQFSGVLGPD